MPRIFTYFIIGLFAALLFVNFYFRVKVLKSYKRLLENRVEFGFRDILNKEKIEKIVIPRYPHAAQDIRDFTNHIRYSIKIGSALILLITALGALLMWFRE
ncbi:MAG TPA: hypothetical protein ENJ20_00265 [Bacteroidetes bacterium]|nr:hypothetical protein [Bacteroidota bacterium]